jgi:hypothetical protein
VQRQNPPRCDDVRRPWVSLGKGSSARAIRIELADVNYHVRVFIRARTCMNVEEITPLLRDKAAHGCTARSHRPAPRRSPFRVPCGSARVRAGSEACAASPARTVVSTPPSMRWAMSSEMRVSCSRTRPREQCEYGRREDAQSIEGHEDRRHVWSRILSAAFRARCAAPETHRAYRRGVEDVSFRRDRSGPTVN